MAAAGTLLIWLVVIGSPEVLAIECNRAVNRTALQSSTHAGFDAERAVDGNIEPYIYDGSCTHTSEDASAWWWVDLGAIITVRQVSLFNRDTSRERLRAVQVGVTSTQPGTPVVGEYPLCGTHPEPVGAYAHITCPEGVQGRYVIVQLDNTSEALTLCEVRVFRTVKIGHDGNSLHLEWMVSERLAGSNTEMVYVRAPIECIARCADKRKCRSVNFARECETGVGCCELIMDPCLEDQVTAAPGWRWLDL